MVFLSFKIWKNKLVFCKKILSHSYLFIKCNIWGLPTSYYCVVRECIKQKLLNPKTVYKSKDVVRDMLWDHRVSLSYEKGWRAKEKAMELIRGKANISYHLLPSNVYILKKQILDL